MLTAFNFNLSGLMTEMNTENKKFKSKQLDEATVPGESKRVFDYQLQPMILYAEFCLRLEEKRGQTIECSYSHPPHEPGFEVLTKDLELAVFSSFSSVNKGIRWIL